jgi:hypothetical protein
MTARGSHRHLKPVGEEGVDLPRLRSGMQHDAVEIARRLSESFAERAADHDRSGRLPITNFSHLAYAGLLGLTVPVEAGGHGGGLELASEVIGIIAQGEPSTALVLSMHYINHATIIHRWPAAIAERLRHEALDSASLINALRVEPELGTPARGGQLATVARQTAEGWRISGHKIYSTGIPVLKWLAVWGRTDEAEPRIGTFLVPAGTPGIRIEPTWNHLGMRATESHDVIFEDVLIPHDHAVDIRPATGWSSPDPTQIAWSTLLVAAIYDGIARAARQWLLRFLNERAPSNLGASLATLPRFQEAVGELEVLLNTNRRLIQGVARDADQGNPPAAAESGLAKVTITNNAIAAVELAVKLAGNPGLSRANPLERHYRDVLCGRIHTPQDDSVRLAAGKIALGL